MATASSSKRRNGSGRRQDSEAYFKRLDPIAEDDSGNSATWKEEDGEGRQVGSVSIYDDRENDGVIHIQVRQGSGQRSKVAVLHLNEDDEGLASEFFDDLAELREELGLE